MIFYRPLAKRDIIDAALWYENQASRLSERFINAVEATLAQLEYYPLSGKATNFLHPELQGLRHFPIADPFDAYMIFYFPAPDGIELLRLLHAKRDIFALLQP